MRILGYETSSRVANSWKSMLPPLNVNRSRFFIFWFFLGVSQIYRSRVDERIRNTLQKAKHPFPDYRIVHMKLWIGLFLLIVISFFRIHLLDLTKSFHFFLKYPPSTAKLLKFVTTRHISIYSHIVTFVLKITRIFPLIILLVKMIHSQ